MYALVSQCRSCDSTLGNCFIQIIHCMPVACVNIISFMKRQRSNFLGDLHWNEKKHIQATCNEVYSSSKKWLLTPVSFILLKSSLFCYPFCEQQPHIGDNKYLIIILPHYGAFQGQWTSNLNGTVGFTNWCKNVMAWQ